MDTDLVDAPSSGKQHFNGAVPIKRARLDLTTTTPDAAQIRRRKEAEKAYGRGRKIPCREPALLGVSKKKEIHSLMLEANISQ